ncbi:MAG TPA: ribonuclease P protein component [Usitatibacter sp.]|nr:ribonuclease P protein component [Usitatibacter sp.]
MPRSARTEGYSWRHRFHARGSFGPVLRAPRKARGRFAVIHASAAPGGISRLGIALTRRTLPNATDRNRVRRLVREIYRRHVVKHSGLDCVVTLRDAFRPTDMQALKDEVAALFEQLRAESSPAR